MQAKHSPPRGGIGCVGPDESLVPSTTRRPKRRATRRLSRQWPARRSACTGSGAGLGLRSAFSEGGVAGALRSAGGGETVGRGQMGLAEPKFARSLASIFYVAKKEFLRQKPSARRPLAPCLWVPTPKFSNFHTNPMPLRSIPHHLNSQIPLLFWAGLFELEGKLALYQPKVQRTLSSVGCACSG